MESVVNNNKEGRIRKEVKQEREKGNTRHIMKLVTIVGNWTGTHWDLLKKPNEGCHKTVLPRDERGKHLIISSCLSMVKGGPTGLNSPAPWVYIRKRNLRTGSQRQVL